ncbi:MAG TPA: COX15/CtaA family protein [Galbitalea sp.]
MTQSPPRTQSLPRRAWDWLPTTATRPIRVLAWLSFVMQVVLIATGGAVRLTASGLGCPTWPQCTAGSVTNTPELGIHGIIEFGNRMLTVLLVIVVIVVFVAMLRMWKTRRDLFVLALLQGISIPVQAVLGGLTVLSGLNPYVVGAHFVLSILLVILTTLLVYRAYRGPRGVIRTAPRWFIVTAHVTSLFVALTVIFGILTTGSGPHPGDSLDAKHLAPRNGLNSQVIQTVHSIPAYVTVALTLLLVVAAWGFARRTVTSQSTRRFTVVLLAIEAVQVVVGLVQASLGLPIALVNIHLVLAALLVAAMTALALSLRSGPAVGDLSARA